MIVNALLYYLIAINIVTFLVYGIDKWKAKQGSWRISESTLLILAVIGGSIGALLGMKIWHHKTMHKKPLQQPADSSAIRCPITSFTPLQPPAATTYRTITTPWPMPKPALQ